MMRFTVDARAFSDAMSKVSKVLRKNPIPILEEIAVCIQNGRCILTENGCVRLKAYCAKRVPLGAAGTAKSSPQAEENMKSAA